MDTQLKKPLSFRPQAWPADRGQGLVYSGPCIVYIGSGPGIVYDAGSGTRGTGKGCLLQRKGERKSNCSSSARITFFFRILAWGACRSFPEMMQVKKHTKTIHKQVIAKRTQMLCRCPNIHLQYESRNVVLARTGEKSYALQYHL